MRTRNNTPPRTILIAFLIWITGLGLAPWQETTEPVIEIFSPLPGEAVQGFVTIHGTVEVEDLISYTLEFSFASQDNPSWFSISEGAESINQGVLGEWDTSTIPDDIYNLRLTVFVQGQGPIITNIDGIRVRNYSVIETSTPEPTSEVPATPTPLPISSPTPTVGKTATATPYARNPAEFSSADIQSAVIRGGIAGIILFIVILLFWLIRQRK